MGKINVLDKHVAELIAAGEVVERPASALKELVENSMDSGATAITVEIRNGGNTFMRVTDNGSGIEPDDIRTAFLRHATSKVKTEEDLNRIGTLGFRGEALASIGAVAKVEMISRTADSEFGTKYVLHGGEEIEFEEAGTALGTTIVVRDLFFNTPARRKFLKKDNTEANVIVALMQHIAVSRPDISFKLIRDSKQVLNTPGDNNLKNAIFTVFGKEFADSLLPCEYRLGEIKVSGFTCKPTASRKNRAMQYFYLNGRFIRTKTGIAALDQAYKNSIMVGTYAACVLSISLDPSLVDVNVHPAKTEVRFADEQSIFNAIYYAVKSAINADNTRVAFESAQIMTAPSFDKGEQLNFSMKSNLQKERADFEKRALAGEFTKSKSDNKAKNYSFEQKNEPLSVVKDVDAIEYDDGEKSVDIKLPKSVFEHNYVNQAPVEDDNNSSLKEQGNDDILDIVETDDKKQKVEFKYIGQAFSVYIIVECDGKLILIDKHAAHERILFEKLKSEADFTPQLLISPVNITLSANEYDAILTNIDRIADFGFEIEDYGMNSVLVRSLPVYLDGEDVKGLIEEIAGKLINKNTDFTPDFLDWLFHSVACRAAIKAGNRSTDDELIALADVVLNDERIRYCPHGRPVAAELSENEIKKRFSRI